jgi:methyl-accepting chemotaxis protein
MRLSNIRISISNKVIIVGAVGVLGLVLVPELYFIGARSIANFQKVADEAEVIGSLSNRFFMQMLQMPRAEKDFILRNDEKFVKLHADLAKSAKENLGAVRQKVAAGGRTGHAIIV